ncbi:hypothetical protein [Microbispora rosea]|uniref:hypothetical protein n=1 Tax=Microbispora rosea TaxID=58117 RepID=UPI0033E256C1
MSSDQAFDNHREEFELWLNAQHKNILRTAYYCCGDPLHAEDIAQEAVRPVREAFPRRPPLMTVSPQDQTAAVGSAKPAAWSSPP